MDREKETSSRFLGTYFDRDLVLRLSRWAEIAAWVVLIVHLLSWLVTVAQFLIQLTSGLFFQKGMNPVDMFSIFTPYILQPVPGIVYFIGLLGVSQALLIFLDMEENLRRAARK